MIFQPVESIKYDSTYFAEIAPAPGPAAEGLVGDGSLTALHGSPWALVWSREDLVLRLYRWDGSDWLEQPPSAVLPVLPRPPAARHLALAFDQAARPVVAWEQNGAIRVRQWDPLSLQYVTRGPFAGVDPVLLNDATVSRVVGGSDVVLFHLSSDRLRLKWRVQREQYAAEHDLLDLGGSPVALAQPAHLDQAVALPWRYELALEQPDHSKLYWRSALYDPFVVERVSASALPLDGGYVSALINAAHTEALAGAAAPRDGGYTAAVLVAARTEALAGSSEPRGGEYAQVVLRAARTEALAGGAAPRDGGYALATLRVERTEALAGTAQPLDGSYSL